MWTYNDDLLVQSFKKVYATTKYCFKSLGEPENQLRRVFFSEIQSGIILIGIVWIPQNNCALKILRMVASKFIVNILSSAGKYFFVKCFFRSSFNYAKQINGLN